jgi:hypothetical protein
LGWKERIEVEKDMDDSKRYHGNRVSNLVTRSIMRDFINEEREALGIQGKEITKAWLKDNVQRAENVSPMAEPLRTVGYQAFPAHLLRNQNDTSSL